MWIDETKPEINLDLTQVGMTEERKEERRKLIGASDMPIIMGDSPYMTPMQLWELKSGITQDQEVSNFAIERGIRWEDRVRKRFEQKTSMEYLPQNFTHEQNPVHSASLDGYNEKYKEGLEIKVTSDKNLKLVKAGQIPPLYKAQVQWQIYVADLKKNNFYVVKVDTDESGTEQIVDEALAVVYRDDAYINDLVKKADEFWQCVTTQTPPPLSDRDCKNLTGQEARKDFAELRYLKIKLDEKKAEVKEYEKAFKVLRDQCLKHCDHTITACEGIKIHKVFRKGSIDMDKMSDEEKLKFEKYRKQDSVSYRVSLVKDEV